jgi:ABC-type multidrug transport system fused ATPase/permease subunit
MGHVMQEPTLFNYSVKDNILYGNNVATNSLIMKCAEIANVLEFITSDEIRNVFDDNAESLVNSFKENKDELMKMIGEDRYER